MIPFWMAHPRAALCDAGVWKCQQHPRMLWLASERRWALRHKLRARRVARYTGWAPGELAGHIEREKRALCERLADDMAVLVAVGRFTPTHTAPGQSRLAIDGDDRRWVR